MVANSPAMDPESSDDEPQQKFVKQKKQSVPIGQVFARILSAKSGTPASPQKKKRSKPADVAGEDSKSQEREADASVKVSESKRRAKEEQLSEPAKKSDASVSKKRKLKQERMEKRLKAKRRGKDSATAADGTTEASEENESSGQHKLRAVERSKIHAAWENMAREKPTVLGKPYERRLQKVATRGVVALFNAVAKQQRTLDHELSKSANATERKREKVLTSLDERSFKSRLEAEEQRTNEFDSADVEMAEEQKHDAVKAAKRGVGALKRPRRAELNDEELVSLFQ